jgi:NAD(P)-dependent dehydrogenase (short-subunit alcohol dehydrogenase family)
VLLISRDDSVIEPKTVATIRTVNEAVNLAKKRAIVVGGTSGIGEGIALRLAKANVSVTVVGRSKERGEEMIDRMSALGGSNHEFIPCNCFMMKNIKQCCEEINKRYDNKVDYLVVTQGMATIQGRTETTEGIDEKLALHYFGRMLFIRELLPALRATAEQDDVTNNPSHSGKVLTVLSAGVHGPYQYWKDDFELIPNYSIPNAANTAGFYNDLALDAFSRQTGNEKITFIHAAPGFVATRWGTEMPWYIKGPVRLLQVFGRSVDDCGEAMCDPLFNHKEGGLVLIDNNANPTKLTTAHSDEARDFVFEKTMERLNKALSPE